MKTLNGFNIKYSFLAKVGVQEGAIELVTTCGFNS